MPKRRVNLCLPEETWQHVKELAARRGVSASVAVEQFVEQVVEGEEAAQQRRLEAWQAIMDLDLGPMGTWEEMEREIETMYESGCPEQ